ncbi:unnamed protein product, partial [Cyprideis torosa]
CQRLLKEGGEMYFSDMYASKPVPESLRRDKVAWGEGLSGALFWRDLYAYCQELGALLDPLPVQASAIEVIDARLKNLISYLAGYSTYSDTSNTTNSGSSIRLFPNPLVKMIFNLLSVLFIQSSTFRVAKSSHIQEPSPFLFILNLQNLEDFWIIQRVWRPLSFRSIHTATVRDLYAYCQELGALLDPLPVQASAIEVIDARLKNLISETCPDGLHYASVTYRIFKKTDKTTSTSALTQEVKYLGSIPGFTDTTFCLSHGRKFPKGESVSVTCELAEVLRMSRYKSHFEFLGDSGSPINPFTILEKTGGSCCSGGPEQEKKCGEEVKTQIGDVFSPKPESCGKIVSSNARAARLSDACTAIRISLGELALKKLKRKVHAEYMACGGEKGKKLLAADEFDKKLMKKIRSCQKFALIGNEREYYGQILKTNDDLKTGACQVKPRSVPSIIRNALKNVHETVQMKYYGCGLPFPEAVEGCSVLDLGCGTGRDVYVLSQLVGPEGRVVGVDMTDEQLAVAREFQPWHEQKFGWKNTEFYQGYIEKLDEISALKEGDFDIIISNCVINLCLDKKAVFRQCQRLLKEGGEMYFSDMYASKPVPEALRRDKVAWGEGLSGALFWRDLYAYCQELGALLDPLPVQASAIEVIDARLKNLISETCPDGLHYASVTYRIFKKTDKTTSTSALTQEVKYLGSIPGSTDTTFCLSHGRKFPKGESVSVTSELAEVLRMSRYKSHFEFLGDSGSPIDPFTILEKTGGSCCSGGPEQEKKCGEEHETQIGDAVPTGGSDEEGEEQQNGGHEATFRWIPVIESVLASKGELALKKLKRK